MSLRFTATSLEDIARTFDARAASAQRMYATTQREVSVRDAVTRTWEDAAQMIRATTLEDAPREKYAQHPATVPTLPEASL